MPRRIKVPWLSSDEIKEKARRFLSQYHSEMTLPIPIEEILDIKLGVNIVPVSNLVSEFDISGFTSADFTTIYVDRSLYDKEALEAKLRLTLAHEAGHFVLHRAIFENIRVENPQQWRAFVDGIPESERGKLEWQASQFAGFVLVPGVLLRQIALKSLKHLIPKVEEAKARGIPRKEYHDSALDLWALRIAPRFFCPYEVIKNRLREENLGKEIP